MNTFTSQAYAQQRMPQRKSNKNYYYLCFMILGVDCLHTSTTGGGGGNTDRRGPEFLVEPPSSVVFLNDTGAIVTCSAKGKKCGPLYKILFFMICIQINSN